MPMQIRLVGFSMAVFPYHIKKLHQINENFIFEAMTEFHLINLRKSSLCIDVNEKLKQEINMKLEDFLKLCAEAKSLKIELSLQEIISYVKEQVDSENEVANELEPLLTPKEVEDILRVDTCTIWRWRRSKYLPCVKVGNQVRFKRSDVLSIMNQGKDDDDGLM